jgi:hypothetical protein
LVFQGKITRRCVISSAQETFAKVTHMQNVVKILRRAKYLGAVSSPVHMKVNIFVLSITKWQSDVELQIMTRVLVTYWPSGGGGRRVLHVTELIIGNGKRNCCFTASFIFGTQAWAPE